MTVDTIIEATARHFGMRACDVIGPGREKTRVKARFIACAIARDMLDLSYTELSRVFGYRDHTTAMSGVRRARQMRLSSGYWFRDFADIEAALSPWRAEMNLEGLELAGP